MAEKQYGVRGPDPKNMTVPYPSLNAAVEARRPGDVLMVRDIRPFPPVGEFRGSWRPTDTEEADR